jgi:hypothetical protein
MDALTPLKINYLQKKKYKGQLSDRESRSRSQDKTAKNGFLHVTAIFLTLAS